MSTQSMKQDLRCPKCEHDVILHVARAFPRLEDDGQTGSLAHVRRTLSLGIHEVTTTGEVEAFACERCGFLEFYLAAPLEIDGVHVRRIGPPSVVTYR